MSFQFPSNYRSVLSLIQTNNYINDFQKKLLEELKLKFSLMELQLPLVSPYSHNYYDKRIIAFDNMETANINELLPSADLWLVGQLERYKRTLNQGLITSYTKLTRDIKPSPIKAINESTILFNSKLLISNKRNEEINEFASRTIEVIISTIKNMNSKFDLGNNIEPLNNVITVSKLSSKYPILSLDKALKKEVITNGMTLVLDASKTTLTNKNLTTNNPIAFDSKLMGKVYWYYASCDELIELVNLGITPNRQDAYDQILIKGGNPLHYTQNINILKETQDTIGIEINLSRWLMIITKKKHIAEVVSSPWGKTFLEECDTKKVDIL